METEKGPSVLVPKTFDEFNCNLGCLSKTLPCAKLVGLSLAFPSTFLTSVVIKSSELLIISASSAKVTVLLMLHCRLTRFRMIRVSCSRLMKRLLGFITLEECTLRLGRTNLPTSRSFRSKRSRRKLRFNCAPLIDVRRVTRLLVRGRGWGLVVAKSRPRFLTGEHFFFLFDDNCVRVRHTRVGRLSIVSFVDVLRFSLVLLRLSLIGCKSKTKNN